MAARLERRLLKKMNHPNIISYYDDYEDINYIGIVMELMANDLRQTMQQVGDGLDENFCRNICKQLFEAVAYCHENQIIHRDIKMENILLDVDPNTQGLLVKLCDFGTA